MKKIALILLLTMVTLFSAEAHKYKNSHVTISIQSFYNELSPYGDWIYSSDFGYVWRPYFDYPEAFRPYSSNGNWVYSELGWTWVSNYNWGWATFHYGRWDFDQYLGWLWIPGYEWAPAWVTWGTYDNYWGWAPMGPNIYVQFNTNWYAPDPWWTFVPRRHFCSENWNHYIYDRPVYVTNINYITNVYVDNNYNTGHHNTWYHGPQVSEVEKYYGHRVSTMKVVDNERHENSGVRNNQLNIYRPTVDNRRNDYRPAEYRNIEQAHRNSTSLSTNPRTNNPGENRSRANKVEQRTSTVTTQNRVEPRNAKQSLPNRSTDVTKDSRETKVTPRTTTKSENRTGSSNKETKVEPRAISQVPVDRNSKGTSVKPRGNDTDLNRNSAITESNRSKTNPARIDNKSSQQTRSNTENLGKVNSPASRGSGSKQATSVDPSRKPSSSGITAASGSRTQNTDRKQSSREVIKQGENQKSVESTEKRKSGNKTSR